MIQSTDYTASREFMTDLFESMPSRTKNPSIVDYAEKTIVPSGKYRGMQYNHKRSPQLKEPLELLSPDSPYRIVVAMFPAQYGKSTLAELATMYYITQVPSEILYVSSNETAAIKWMERRIVPRASDAGVVFRSEIESRQSRKTGDTSYSKLFPGGNIDIASALSPAQLASETKRVILADEVDRWKIQLGDEGSVWDMIVARTQAWGSQSIILPISTPTTEDGSMIYQLYLQGDQRQYFVPCPKCGEMQLMDFSLDQYYGMHWETKKGKILRKSIVLVCRSKSCQAEIREPSKHKMLNGGEWRSGGFAEYDFIASFTSNGLYSPMLSWYDMIISYEESKTGPLKKQAHENLKMGRPYKETGTRPKVDKIIENQGTYKAGTVQDGVLYLTMMVDVQTGSKTDKKNPPRLELEIMGMGAGYRTWSVDYLRFEGEIGDAYSGAWEKLYQFGIDTELTFYRSDGFGFTVSLVLIDSGDGNFSNVVYEFCERWTNFYPSKGRNEIKQKKTEKVDEIIQGNMQRYRQSRLDSDVTLYLINTNYYKNQIYNHLKIQRQEGEIQKSGFCDFPGDYKSKFFDMLTAEEKRRDGSFHNPHGRRNESLDTRVGCLCAADIFLDSEVEIYRLDAKGKGAKPHELKNITRKSVLEIITEQTRRKE